MPVACQRLQADSRCDIVEQSLRAADVLADYPGVPVAPHAAAAAASLSLACTPTSSLASSVAHPLGAGVDCVLDYSQQQQPQLIRRRYNDDIFNNNNNNNNSSSSLLNCGRHGLSDIVTPTSDVTTASSPSETLSQVNILTSLSVSYINTRIDILYNPSICMLISPLFIKHSHADCLSLTILVITQHCIC